MVARLCAASQTDGQARHDAGKADADQRCAEKEPKLGGPKLDQLEDKRDEIIPFFLFPHLSSFFGG